MKKSINAWSVPGDIGFREMFEKISKAGFDGIELNLDAEDRSVHSLTMDTGGDKLREIKKLAEDLNLKIAAVSTSLTGGRFGSDNKLRREEAKDIVKKQIECAQALGCDSVLTVPGGMAEEVGLLKSSINSMTALTELKDYIAASKIYVALENVWNGFFTSPFHMNSFIDELQCEYIGAYFDVGNVVAFSEPEHWIEILGSRIKKIHVKDFQRIAGINRGGVFVNLLEGSVNWEKVIKALKDVGYDDYLTAELAIMEPCPDYLYEITSKAMDIILEMEEKA